LKADRPCETRENAGFGDRQEADTNLRARGFAPCTKKLVTPAARRQAVAIAPQEHGLSRRRACRLVGISRAVVEREPKRARDHARLRERLRALAGERRRFGYRRLHELLRREGFVANHKDDCTRECPAILVDFSLPGSRVVGMLEDVAGERGYPDMLVVDNGPEFRGRELDRWAYEHGVQLFFIDPGKPMQNGSIESFNGRFREECLDQSWFTSLAEAERTIEAWRLDYNERRPHTSLRMRTPAAFAAVRPFAKPPRPVSTPEAASPSDLVAAVSPPVLSGSSGFP
jgi:transposase InsO family protein